MKPLTFVGFAGGQPSHHHCLRYANTLALALAVAGQVWQLRIRNSLEAPAALVAEHCSPEQPHCAADEAAELARVAQELRAAATEPAVPHLPSSLLQELAARHHPLLFVLSQTYSDSTLAATCADLLKTSYPVLVVPPTIHAGQLPRRILIAADREPFCLAANSRPLRQLLHLPNVEVFVGHVAGVLEDGQGYGLAQQAVLGSGLVEGLPSPELRRYEFGSYPQGLLAAVHDTHADLIVVLTRQRSYFSQLFHRSVTARLLALCPVPVLMLPTTPAEPPAETPSDPDLT